MKTLIRPLLVLTCAASLRAQTPPAVPPPLPPLLGDTALKVEVFASFPNVETPTTVAAGPDGSVYVGNDPRDSRLNTKAPECTITRFAPDGKQTVFAKDLFSPAGSLWHDGWLYVSHNPLLSRFKDTNGDGVADVREDIVTSLGPPPHEGLNDHVVSGFTLGMDGFLYISTGDKGVYHATGKDGSEATLQGGGVVRCRPDGTALEVYSGGTRNHLEVDLDAMDRAFTLDNTDDGNGWWTRLNYHIESGYYGYPFYYKNDQTNGLKTPGPQKAQFWPGAPEVNERFLPALTDFGGGSPCGGLCYMSDGLPEKYRGKLLFSEWGQRNVSAIEVAPDGAGFKFVNRELMLTEDKGGNFRPMQMYVAADGSLLISDWGFGGWKSGPKTVGTVWRVSWPDAKPAPRLANEEKASVEELIKALDHVDRDQRLRAEWALVHRGESAIPQLIETMNNLKASDVQRAHALWSLDLIGEKSAELRKTASGLIRQLLKAESANVRVQATRALATRGAAEAAGEIAALLQDKNAEVRLQAAIALGRLHASAGTSGLIKALDDDDRWVRFVSRAALAKIGDWQAVGNLLTADQVFVNKRTRDQAWLTLTYAYDERAVQFLTRIKGPDEYPALDALGQLAYMPKEWDGHWWATQPVKSPPPLNSVAWAGTATAVKALTDALASNQAPLRLAAAKALALSTGQEALPALRARLTAEQDPEVRRQIVETLGLQKDPATLAVFSQIALDQKSDAGLRETAVNAVANIGGKEAKPTLLQLLDVPLSPVATRRVVEVLGDLRAPEAAAGFARHAASTDAALRLAAIKGLSNLGAKANALEIYTATLKDKDFKVVTAALEALGNLHDPKSLEALLEYGKKHKGQRELVTALAQINDPQTLPIMLDGLNNNDQRVRRAAIGSLKKMQAQSWPLIQERIAAGKISADYLPEIKSAFESGYIPKWKVLGPFENVWGAMHPPETEALAAGGQPDLKKKYTTAEKPDVGWRDANAEQSQGKVDLGDVFKNTGMVCAYAYAEINATAAADARLFCGSDDQIAVWLNGKKVHDFGASRGFDPDSDQVAIHLEQGVNRLFVKIGNQSGTWLFSAHIPGLDGTTFTPATGLPPDVLQRNFALALKADGTFANPGDAKHGEQIFSDPNGPLAAICATCHVVKGKGGPVGPDLSAIAVNYKRPDLITSIQEPSKTIALGFEAFAVETKGGDTFLGAIRQETGDAITVLGADAQPHVVKKADVKSRTAIPASLMPPGLTLGLKPQDFTDLLAYLETLKGQ
ncbi:MAG TPA: PVC-type heme-binding CxxCH protein [Chthoniobacteraceae bacterium]|jgi:putative membrane-bound dehydrogenase-like protein|nr:PVC-type heme-binding CxxCH protein [Chthoniobacteraceae bacterium]